MDKVELSLRSLRLCLGAITVEALHDAGSCEAVVGSSRSIVGVSDRNSYRSSVTPGKEK